MIMRDHYNTTENSRGFSPAHYVTHTLYTSFQIPLSSIFFDGLSELTFYLPEDPERGL